MTTGAPSWGTCRVHGTWHSQTGKPLAGTYAVSVPVRVTNTPDDVIVPAAVYATGYLSTTGGLSLDLQVPATNDPDNSPSGWQVIVMITFENLAQREVYYLDCPDGGDIDLRTVLLPSDPFTPQAVVMRGVPGGLAELDADGDVIDADGNKILGGGGGGGNISTYADVQALPGYPATFPPTLPIAQTGVTGLTDALAAKADLTVTDALDSRLDTAETALTGKADTTYVDSGLAVKADKTYVDSQDATKADLTVTDALDARLDSAEASLATKAATSYVDSQDAALSTTIAAKVNSADLAAVATSGSYADLTEKPILFVNSLEEVPPGTPVDTLVVVRGA